MQDNRTVDVHLSHHSTYINYNSSITDSHNYNLTKTNNNSNNWNNPINTSDTDHRSHRISQDTYNADSNQNQYNTTHNKQHNHDLHILNYDTIPTADISSVSHDNAKRSHSNHTYILGSGMSYTSNGASKMESSAFQEIEQRWYPQESASSVTTDMTVLLTTPQSGGWEPRIGHGSSTEKLQELSARQMDKADDDTLQINERMAHTVPCARKRKECPTKAEQRNIRSRYMESTHTTLEVQVSLETGSHSTLATSTSRPVIGSEWIQHQGQPRDRTSMARERGSTGYSSEVLEVGKMAASPQKVRVTAALMNTSRGVKDYDGEDIIQSLEHKQGGRGGIG